MATYGGNQLVTKISGYIEKKGRLRIGSLWKKYWFVLEGRLLLYYRSKDEYEAISPCKGSINLCPPCTIKPASATSCIFQIVGRATTVTLRAESRYEQERWMQALLTAIDHSKSSPSRLSHFRYSLDELPMPCQENEVEKGLHRQNSMPYNTSIPRQDIIERLQTIGAHSYGGSLDAFTKYAPNIQRNDIFKNNKYDRQGSNSSLPRQNGSLDVIVRNDQYSTIQEENSLDVRMAELNSRSMSLDHIRSSKSGSLPTFDERNMIENDQYHRSNNATNKTREEKVFRNRKIKKSESLYERGSGDSNKFSGIEIRVKRKSSNIYERISGSSSSSEKQIRLNGKYAVVKKQSRESLQSLIEPEYSIPMTFEDHNKNSLMIENDQYTRRRSGSNGTEYSKINSVKDVELLYEDPDVIPRKLTREPTLPPRPELKKLESPGENSNNNSLETKNKKSRLQMLAQLIKSDKRDEPASQNTQPKKKRSASFIQKMLRKKEKPVDTTDDVVYEVISNGVEKPKEVNDVEMLEELQKILEARKAVLQRKLKAQEAQSVNNTNKLPENQHKERDTAKTVEVTIDNRPSLPPRQNSQSTIQINQQTNIELDTFNLINTTNGRIANDQIKTIHEIIEDLDREKSIQDSNRKVKTLIEKFNDLHNEDDILLRRKVRKNNIQRSESVNGVPMTFSKYNSHQKRDSDELNKLLEELCKVTSAPILTPGVTCSLTTPVITDDEWAQVIPIRYRRLSDPDYDIPRPHSSLNLQNRTKQLPENALPATRFFGPVLLTTNKTLEPDSLSSMDLDSLEVEQQLPHKTNETKYFIKGEKDSISSYKSHNYTNLEDVVYLQPKSILFNFKLNHKMNGGNIEMDKTLTPPISPVAEETFVDSLEPSMESTRF